MGIGLAQEPPERACVMVLDAGVEQPNEENRPAEGGTTMRFMPSACAMPQANTGPLPPKANSANSRGSRPRSLDTDLIARIMFDAAMRCAPCAARSIDMPRGSTIFLVNTSRALAALSLSAPPTRCTGLM